MRTDHRDLTLINKGAMPVQPSDLSIQRVSINHPVKNGFGIRLLSRLNVVIDQQLAIYLS
jgi:hypothetical protein